MRNNFPEAGAYSTAYSHVYSEGEIVPARIEKIPPAPWEGLFPDYFLSASYGEPPVWSSAVAIQREIFDHVGFFKVGEKMGEDLDMWGRIALHYPMAFSWQGVAFYRKDATARACLMNYEKELPFVRFVKEQRKTKEISPSVKKYVGVLQLQLIHSLIKRGERRQAMKNLLSIDLRTCSKYSYFRSLSLIMLPKPLVKFIRLLKRVFLIIFKSLAPTKTNC